MSETIASYILDKLNHIHDRIPACHTLIKSGKVSKIIGFRIEAVGISAAIGTLCHIISVDKSRTLAEVVGFCEETVYLMSLGTSNGIKQGDLVVAADSLNTMQISSSLLGRIIDGLGQPIDGGAPLKKGTVISFETQSINPLLRAPIVEPLDVGVRVINGLFTIGKGQRLGIFAGSGVGKSVLLGMMTKFTQADVVVVGLVGERGREVKEFIEDILGEEGLKKSIVVASPSDTSPLLRGKAATLATSIAEHYRDQGLNVLLLMDSLTRYAQALREISLAVGELPATKGYTPSVFSKLSQLVERAGNGMPGKGSITAFYTVLVEGDDINDPIADHARSILDGHIVLSRELADAAHFPAVDVEKSISRVMNLIVSKQHWQWVNEFRNLYSLYNKNKELINLGMYQAGMDKRLDLAIALKDQFNAFLVQDNNQSCSFEHSLQALTQTGITQC